MTENKIKLTDVTFVLISFDDSNPCAGLRSSWVEMRSIPHNLAKIASKFPQEIRIDEEGVTHQVHRKSLPVFDG